MSTLRNKKIKDTYEGLLKISTNLALDGTLTQIQDGTGQDSGVKINNLGDIELNKLKFTALEDSNAVEINEFLLSSEPFVATDTKIPTVESVKTYVDGLDAGSDLDITDGTNTGDVNLNTQSLSILGTANEIETVVSGQGVTIGLPSSISTDLVGNVTGDLTGNVTGNVTGNSTGIHTGNVTGNVTGDLTGNVTGDLTGNVNSSSVLSDGVTANTQSAGDNSTKVATTEYVNAAASAIPIGDYLPLAGGTLTGALTGTSASLSYVDVSSGSTALNGVLFGSTFSSLRKANGGANIQMINNGNVSVIIDSDNSAGANKRWFNIMKGSSESSTAREIFEVDASGNTKVYGDLVAYGKANIGEAGNYSLTLGTNSLTVGYFSASQGVNSFSAGYFAKAIGKNSVATGKNTIAQEVHSFATGEQTLAAGYASFATGRSTKANGFASSAFGEFSISSGNQAAAFGTGTIATGNHSFASGSRSESNGARAFATGLNTVANGANSFTAGKETKAEAAEAFAIGNNTTASGINAFASGAGTIARGYRSAAFGYYSIAGTNCVAMGKEVVTNTINSIAVGQHNDYSQYPGQTQFVVGIGADYTERENGFIVTTLGKFIMPKLATSPSYTNDVSAASGGVAIGELYRNGSAVNIRVS